MLNQASTTHLDIRRGGRGVLLCPLSPAAILHRTARAVNEKKKSLWLSGSANRAFMRLQMNRLPTGLEPQVPPQRDTCICIGTGGDRPGMWASKCLILVCLAWIMHFHESRHETRPRPAMSAGQTRSYHAVWIPQKLLNQSVETEPRSLGPLLDTCRGNVRRIIVCWESEAE